MRKRVWRKLDAVAYTESSTTAVRWDQKGWAIVEGVWYPLDDDPAELVGVLVEALEAVERCTLYGAADQAREKMRLALDRAREWQKGGSDGE